MHQIELEMQAEELQIARDEAEIAAEKYTMLYDFAPVGYFTLDHYNTIIELNFSGARMLSESRNDLANSDFSLFVTHDTRPIFNDFMQKIIELKNEINALFIQMGKEKKYFTV